MIVLRPRLRSYAVLVPETVACRPVDSMSDAVAELASLFEL